MAKGFARGWNDERWGCPRCVRLSAANTSTVARRDQLLVVCCAAGAADQLEPAFDLLRGRGFEIAIIEDTKVGTPAAIEQVRRHGTRAIYVLVKSEDLDSGSSGRFAQVLRTTKVLPKHIVEVVLDWRDPLALVHQLQELELCRSSSQPQLRRRVPSDVAAGREPTGPLPTVAMASSRAHPPTPPPIDTPTAPPVSLRTTDGFRRLATLPRKGYQNLTRTRARALSFMGGVVALVLIGTLGLISGETPPIEEEAAAAPSHGEDSAESMPSGELLVEESIGTRQEAIAQAQALGQLDVHDGIVYAPLESPKQDFHAAAALCDQMNHGLLEGWRMPTLGEIHSLAAARVIERGVYWSGTEPDGFPGRGLIWSEKNTRAAPIGKHWKGARAICILDP